MNAKTAKCIEMINEGVYTFEISEQLNISINNICCIARRYGIRDKLRGERFRKLTEGDTCIYPAIKDFIVERYNGNRAAFIRAMPFSSYTNESVLNGYQEPKKPYIDAVLRLTGMTYEEAFRTE